MPYYKDQCGQPVFYESESNAEGLTKISKAEYETLVHKQEICIELNELKFELKKTDYIALKLAEVEGEERESLKETYATQLARRAELRARINELESTLE